LPLKTIKEFNYIYKNSKVFHTKFFVLFYLDDKNKRFSVVASKKVGNAVKRNFAKRRLRALFIQKELKNGSFVLVAKKDILEADFKQLKYLFNKSLNKLLS